jgi:hypothetical protein
MLETLLRLECMTRGDGRKRLAGPGTDAPAAAVRGPARFDDAGDGRLGVQAAAAGGAGPGGGARGLYYGVPNPLEVGARLGLRCLPKPLDSSRLLFEVQARCGPASEFWRDSVQQEIRRSKIRRWAVIRVLASGHS